MKISNCLKPKPSLLAAVLIVLVLSAASRSQPPSSAESSPKPATLASEPDARNVVSPCAAAVEELAAIRRLVSALENENAGLRGRLETARRLEAVLIELNAERRGETDALRAAIAAKDKEIEAKDTAMKQQTEMISELKKRKSSPLKRLGDVLAGIAIAAILR